jgi:HTH-type transcriptional regulator, competence development regulator
VPAPPAPSSLGRTLAAARARSGLSLRAVERQTGIRSGHLSQIETDRISKPELAMLWDLAALYGVDFDSLVSLSGHAAGRETSDRQRRRMTVALRAMRDLTPAEQTEALRFMAALRARRDDG